MNFFGHATIASTYCRRPIFIFGSMLPDFISICRTQLTNISDPELAAGVEFHHKVDDIFHRSPIFVDLCSQAVKMLCDKSIQRSSARAIAHAGIELLLDGILGKDHSVYSVYIEALKAGKSKNLFCSLSFSTPVSFSYLSSLLNRLENSHVIENYRNFEFVANRLHDILISHPKLRFEIEEIEAITEWVQFENSLVLEKKNELLYFIHDKIRSTNHNIYFADSYLIPPRSCSYGKRKRDM